MFNLSPKCLLRHVEIERNAWNFDHFDQRRLFASSQPRLGRFATKESFQGRMPSKPQQLDNARSVRPRKPRGEPYAVTWSDVV